MNIFGIFKNTTVTQKLNYLLLFYYSIWYALNLVFHVGDGAGRIGIILFAISLVANYNERNIQKLLRPKSIKIWIVWVIYVSVYWLSTGLNYTIYSEHTLSRGYMIYAQMFIPCYIMAVAYLETARNTEKFTSWILLLFVAYSLIGVLWGREGFSSDEGRNGTVLGNGMPILCMSTIFLAFFRRMKGWISRKTLLVIIIFALYCIISAATRKAFGGALIVLLFGTMGLYELYQGKKLFLLVVGCLLAYVSVEAILDSTVLGERLSGTQDQGAMYNDTGYEWLNFLGDRALQYVTGFELFLTKPLTGIGITNYKLIAYSNYPIHSEYIVQLCECGLIGVVLFLLFYNSLFRSILSFGRTSNENKRYMMLFLGYMFMMLFLNLTAWTYSLVSNFTCFGIIIAVSTISFANYKSTQNG